MGDQTLAIMCVDGTACTVPRYLSCQGAKHNRSTTVERSRSGNGLGSRIVVERSRSGYGLGSRMVVERRGSGDGLGSTTYSNMALLCKMSTRQEYRYECLEFVIYLFSR